MARGGYQKPSNPAPVSGPGAMSKRTDRGQPVRDPGGLPYGDNQELSTVQASAPMSGASPSSPSGPTGVPLADMSPNLFDPTGMPDVPVTAGMPFGPGPGPGASTGPIPAGPTRERLLAALPSLLRAAESDYVSPEFRALVGYLRSVASG